ncbi:MAG: hypothetical protein WC517_05050, partial [Patescibacteria group bacterium]
MSVSPSRSPSVSPSASPSTPFVANINPTIARATISATQAQAAYLGAHYDWMDSPVEPLATFTAINPNVSLVEYGLDNILNLVGDQSAASDALRGTAQKWYEWCYNNAVDWETGFLHLANADTYVAHTVDASYGAVWDCKIRYVLDTSSATNLSDAMTAGTGTVALDHVNDALYFGRLDRFDELNLEFSTSAHVNWAGRWEYWNGSSWTLLTTTDGTNDCTQNGTITFTPPTAAEWARCKVNTVPAQFGAQGIYWIRLRCTSTGTTNPTISKARGRKYWTPTGTSGNTIPAWDDDNDSDGDGWKDASVNAAATAHFKYESRVPDAWSWCQFVSRIGLTTWQEQWAAFTIDSMDAKTAGGASIAALRVDNVMGDCNIPSEARTTGILEYVETGSALEDAWVLDRIALLSYARHEINLTGRSVGGNTGWRGTTFAPYLDWVLMEDVQSRERVSSGSVYWGWEEVYWAADNLVQTALARGQTMIAQYMQCLYYSMGESAKSHQVTNGSDQMVGVGTSWLTTVDPGAIVGIANAWGTVASVESDTNLTLTAPWSGASTTTTGVYIYLPREWMHIVASYLVLFDVTNAALMAWASSTYYTGTNAAYFNTLWNLDAVDYGTATEVVPAGKTARGTLGAYIYQTGVDPSHAGSTYYVYAKEYTNFLVLCRPKSTSGGYAASSAVTVSLPGPMQPLLPDGTLGAAATSVVLRGEESVMLTAAGSASTSSSPSLSYSPSVSESASPSVSPSRSVSSSPSVSQSLSPSFSPSFSQSASYSPSVSESASPSSSPSASASVSPSASISVSPSLSYSPSVSESRSPSVSQSASISLSPSASESVSPSRSPSRSPSVSISASPSVSVSVSPSLSYSPSRSPSRSASRSISASSSRSPSRSPSLSYSPSRSISS